MGLKLSIVVPVYNVKPYLERCVQSLLNQDLEKSAYEIILVDDGSTDGGGALCDAIVARETNVSVIHQPNQGLSAARNTGMAVAQGTYLQFVDSDDYLEDNVLSVLLHRMEEQALEILRFGVRRVQDGEMISAHELNVHLEMEEVMDGPEFLVKKLWYSCYAWQFIILRRLLVEHSLTFKPGIIFEDTEWTPRLMQVASRVSSIDIIVYNYVIRPGSITSGASDKKIDSLLMRMDDLKMQMQQLEDKRWYRGMLSQFAVGVITSVSLNHYEDRKRYLEILKAKGLYPLSSFLATKKARRKIVLINLSPRLACFFIRLMNK